jgi:hypothetical protein
LLGILEKAIILGGENFPLLQHVERPVCRSVVTKGDKVVGANGKDVRDMSVMSEKLTLLNGLI